VETIRVARELNVIALVKGDERYVYVYDDTSGALLEDVFRDHAADPNLSLNWFDALVLVKKTRQQSHHDKSAARPRLPHV
jgi:hypothetical protein